MRWWEAAGLGLDHDELRFARTTTVWLRAGAALRQTTAELLEPHDVVVEHIGSSSVQDLLAKPILDLAVGVAGGVDVAPIRSSLECAEWIYRGDAGEDGGHVFVYETRPRHRVAHLHVVEHGGRQWRDYLALRDLLRIDAAARHRYATEKLRLAHELRSDRAAYTAGKSGVVRDLLGG